MDALLRTVARALLALRYQVRVRGVNTIARRGTRGILFLPNHPALIDPVILMTVLHGRFRPRALADADQLRLPVVGRLARRLGAIAIPDIKVYGQAVRGQVEAAAAECAAALRAGQNVLIYPSGHIYRTRHEDLRGNSGVAEMLRAAPATRVVLVRTRGLWGSCLSMASGEYPNLAALFWPRVADVAQSLLLLVPRRPVTIELHEPADFPRDAGRAELNAYLERFYNAGAPPHTHIAYTPLERPRRAERPEPQWGRAADDDQAVPPAIRTRVLAHLTEQTGVANPRPTDRLAQDLGLDSLARADLLLWLEREFGCTQQDGDALGTVGDVLLAACGQAIVTRPVPLTRPPAAWFAGDPHAALRPPTEARLTDAFLAAARRQPGRVVLADQRSGVRRYRDVITAILALRPSLRALDGAYVGIMLPASVAATVTYWATLFAGKAPLMVNWTTGARNVLHGLNAAGVRHVLTSRVLAERIASQGIDLAGVRERFVYLEDVGARIGRGRRLWAWLRGWLNWSELDRAAVPETAVVLTTSGSESVPKAVPLTHTNILTNLRDVAQSVRLADNDRLLGFLPPFHSFGLTVTVVAPLALGLRAVYHANPTEALQLVRLTAAYRATIMLGTPTFLAGILRAAPDGRELASVRLAVTGAEKCPERVYQALAARCPRAVVLEGYGITECAPIVAVNRVESAQAGTVGPVLPSVEAVLVDVDTGAEVPVGRTGLLLVRGPSIFPGYLGADAASPFVTHAGQQWYCTGDLLRADAAGVLTFCGRLKRFVKLGGEMVSLPAIEAALAPYLSAEDDEGPALAVVATASELRPELVLFVTRPADRAEVNRLLRAAGLSGLHTIGRVRQVEQIPVLGNGKTDYRALAALVDEAGQDSGASGA